MKKHKGAIQQEMAGKQHSSKGSLRNLSLNNATN